MGVVSFAKYFYYASKNPVKDNEVETNTNKAFEKITELATKPGEKAHFFERDNLLSSIDQASLTFIKCFHEFLNDAIMKGITGLDVIFNNNCVFDIKSWNIERLTDGLFRVNQYRSMKRKYGWFYFNEDIFHYVLLASAAIWNENKSIEGLPNNCTTTAEMILESDEYKKTLSHHMSKLINDVNSFLGSSSNNSISKEELARADEEFFSYAEKVHCQYGKNETQYNK